MRAIAIRVPLLAVLLLLLATAPGPSPAQVYKCQIDGQTVYRDSPCKGGQQLDPKALQGNTMDAPGARAAGGSAPVSAPPVSTAAPADMTPGRTCPTSVEIRNMETTASSISLSPLERRLKQMDVERARKCQPLLTEAEKAKVEDEYRGGRGVGGRIPRTIVGCNGTICTDDVGDQYYRRTGMSPDQWFRSSDGRACQRDNNLMLC
jgi:hypothetical protein